MVRFAKTTGALLVLSIAGSFGSVCATGPAATQRSMAVQYRDLDLTEPSDVVILYQRIRLAAARLCGPRELGGPDIDSMLYHDCVKDAVAGAVSAVDRPGLSAYHMTQLRR
jgi:UrcA family protein